MRHNSGLTLAIAALPVIALCAALVGVAPPAYSDLVTRMLTSGWAAVFILLTHLGPLVAIVIYRQSQTRNQLAQGARQVVKRPAVDSGPFGRLIE